MPKSSNKYLIERVACQLSGNHQVPGVIYPNAIKRLVYQRHFMTLPLVETSTSLHSRDDRLARYAYQMFSGLAYLHYHKIVHRDWSCELWEFFTSFLDRISQSIQNAVACLNVSRAGHQSGELHANIAPCIFYVAGKISWQYLAI